MVKWVYNFGDGSAEGSAKDKNLLGGKGANLAEMSNLGLPVPPGFTITTEVCSHYYANQNQYPKELFEQVEIALDRLAKQMHRKFGSEDKPLLLSVRSGARASMPGMMDTVLNLGLNDKTVQALAKETQNERFAYDSYRRFIQMYSNVVLDIEHHMFEEALDDLKLSKAIEQDTDLDADDLKTLVNNYKEIVKEQLGREFPQDPQQQLWGAIGAVFSSWMRPRAITYRRLNNIPETWGTAVNVQAMVFGNMGNNCATGVAFTRNPSTGENKLYGEFLLNAQGEDVVAGIRTPQNISEEARIEAGCAKPSLEKLFPDVFKYFTNICSTLEKHYRDMQDLEFTVENGKLWMLQARNGKRTAKAALKIAVNLVEEGILTPREAILRIDPRSLDQLLHPTIDPKADKEIIAKGLPASPGSAVGELVFSSEEAEKVVAEGRKVILARIETSPEDINGMNVSEGILTTRGGMTSHAAVVARGMGKPCISGAGSIKINYKTQSLVVGDVSLSKGDIITIDGSTGEVLKGKVRMLQPELSGDFAKLMSWADEIRRMNVRANAETPEDARTARSFGAEGIGLCRTEHMFFNGERIIAVREMILAETEKERKIALAKLLPMQRQDFIELFSIMEGLPVTIRLLDPPLHEFLPKTDEEMQQVSTAMGVSKEKLKILAENLHEFNPMLGLRGCRLSITYPEIAEMQARAIFEAVAEIALSNKLPVVPEIMVPLVALKEELAFVRSIIEQTALQVMKEKNIKFDYIIGTMIELPRAALCARSIAEEADFFSFGTNDLTQTTLGISRDDSTPFLSTYIDQKILKQDPFSSIDIEGVGELVKIGTDRGRETKKDLKVGVCGEHGGDSDSISLFEKIGLDYVSCSPYRVPIARLAAAQAYILKDS
ncbi:pyruvate, phosphate dikinase [Bartonella sp. DGB1]|uniref:pyruvate, phosphate dikinase n=1 Tax=Bartonella sp. DGB1 TaxID=3239807 RepID=UPI0035268A4C